MTAITKPIKEESPAPVADGNKASLYWFVKNSLTGIHGLGMRHKKNYAITSVVVLWFIFVFRASSLPVNAADCQFRQALYVASVVLLPPLPESSLLFPHAVSTSAKPRAPATAT